MAEGTLATLCLCGQESGLSLVSSLAESSSCRGFGVGMLKAAEFLWVFACLAVCVWLGRSRGCCSTPFCPICFHTRVQLQGLALYALWKGVSSLGCYRATGQSCPHAALLPGERCAWAELRWLARAALLPGADAFIPSTQMQQLTCCSDTTSAAGISQSKPATPKQGPKLHTSNQGPASAFLVRKCQGHASSTRVLLQ